MLTICKFCEAEFGYPTEFEVRLTLLSVRADRKNRTSIDNGIRINCPIINPDVLNLFLTSHDMKPRDKS